jgi:hypothetical protein
MVLVPESTAFVLLGLFDLIISRVAFEQWGPWKGYEVNPLAAYFLRYYQVKGWVFYKFALTALVVVCCQIFWYKYPRIARGVLLVGCILLSYVILDTAWRLYTHVGRFPWW